MNIAKRSLIALFWAIFLLPVLVGAISTLAPAFGWLPVIGANQPSLAPFRELLAQPALAQSLLATLVSGWGATLASLVLALWLLQHGFASHRFQWLHRSLSVLLAVPHAAYALGMFALLAATGWPARLWGLASGETLAPNLSLTQDPWGLSLLATLALRETPFVLLMSLAAYATGRFAEQLKQARLLGYHDSSAFWPVVVPQLLPMLRWPLLVVLAYNLSVVDVAMIIGPTLPPTLAVLTHQWFGDPDLTMRLQGASAAVLLTGVIVLSALVWLGIERILCWLLLAYQHRRPARHSIWLARGASGVLWLSWLGGALWLVSWAFTQRWRFPDIWPSAWQLTSWTRTVDDWWPALQETLLIGCASALCALLLVILLLELAGGVKRWQTPLLYLPLILPQVGFLFFIPGVFARLGLGNSYLATIWLHLVFVVPYTYLLLAKPYQSLPAGYLQQALLLSRSRWAMLWQVKWRLLLPSFVSVFAIGFSVSVSQYLATLYASGGRIETITTLTVNASSGGDRRLIAVFALIQWLLPFIVFLTMAGWQRRATRWQRV